MTKRRGLYRVERGAAELEAVLMTRHVDPDTDLRGLFGPAWAMLRPIIRASAIAFSSHFPQGSLRKGEPG